MVAPLFLPQENWSFDSGKNNGVVCAHVMQDGTREMQPMLIVEQERRGALHHGERVDIKKRGTRKRSALD